MLRSRIVTAGRHCGPSMRWMEMCGTGRESRGNCTRSHQQDSRRRMQRKCKLVASAEHSRSLWQAWRSPMPIGAAILPIDLAADDTHATHAGFLFSCWRCPSFLQLVHVFLRERPSWSSGGGSQAIVSLYATSRRLTPTASPCLLVPTSMSQPHRLARSLD